MLAGACAPGLVPAAASAAPVVPDMPRMASTDFRVSIVARQTTTWRESPNAAAADCSEYWTTRGDGKETVTMRTRRPFVLTAYRTGRRVEFVPGLTRRGAMESLVSGRTDRRANVLFDVTNCAEDTEYVRRGGPYDCGVRSYDRTARLQIGWSRIMLDLSGEPLLAPLVRTDYESCPVYANTHVATNGITRISQSFPSADLFDPALKKHIVLASKTFRLRDGRFSGSTTVRWELTMVRTKAINRIGL